MTDQHNLDGLTVAGHHFYPNGDLLVAYHDPANNVIRCRRVGFRNGVKRVIDIWSEPRCRHCGCSRGRHALACSRPHRRKRVFKSPGRR